MSKMTVLQAVAYAMAGDGQCCGIHNDDGTCCMTDSAREVFAAIADVGGPTLSEIEAIARGDAAVTLRGARKAIETLHAEEDRLDLE